MFNFFSSSISSTTQPGQQQQQRQQQQQPPPSPSPQPQQQRNVFSFSIARNNRARNSNRGGALTVPPKKMQLPPTDKKTDASKSLVGMLVDRSGSMASMGTEVSGGCNSYLDEQRKADGENKTETHVLFSVFDHSYDLVRDGALLQQPEITNEEVAPRGSTALFDSIACVIHDMIEHIKKCEVAPANVGVFILTDGFENASHIWTKQMIKDQIKLLEGEPYKWEFYFAAANQDAMNTGASMGIKAQQCVTYGGTPKKMKAAFSSASAAFTRQKRGLPNMFTAEERMECYE